jgi:hypothetical protein
MPSTKHELPLELLRRRPELVAQLLRAMGLEVDAVLVPRSETFAQLSPSSYAADGVLEGEHDTIVIESLATTTSTAAGRSTSQARTRRRASARCSW